MADPKILVRLTNQLRAKGDKSPRENAIRFLRNSGILEKDSLALTKKGVERNNMTPAERAIDRQSKYSGNDKADYEYDPKTNRATLRYGKGYR